MEKLEIVVIISVGNGNDIQTLLHSTIMMHKNCYGGRINTQWDKNNKLLLTCQKCKKTFLLSEICLDRGHTDIINLLTKKIKDLRLVSNNYEWVYIIWFNELRRFQEKIQEAEERKEKTKTREMIFFGFMIAFIILILLIIPIAAIYIITQ